MMFNLYIDNKMCFDEKISGNAGLIFGVMRQLMNLSYANTKMIEGKVYYILHKDYILQQIPMHNIKTRTLTTLLLELRQAQLIVSDDARHNPAYALTTKADSYISSKKTNDVESGSVAKEKKKSLFELQKMTPVIDLKPEYYKLLREHCLTMALKKKVPSEEFDNFIAHHGSKGTKFKNYIMAFATWCGNYKKFNQNLKDGESKNGLYR